MTCITKVGEARPAAGETPSAGPIYRYSKSKDAFPKLDGVSTLFELFDKSVVKFAKQPCLGHRVMTDAGAGDFKFITYEEVGAKVKDIASAIRSVGVKPQQRVGIYAANCPEWMITMQVSADARQTRRLASAAAPAVVTHPCSRRSGDKRGKSRCSRPARRAAAVAPILASYRLFCRGKRRQRQPRRALRAYLSVRWC